MVLAKPQISVSTKAVYEKLRVDALGPEAHPDIDGMAAAIRAGSLDGVTAVSYTHLDVYKRQPLKLGIYSGCAVAVFGLLMMAYTIWTWAKYGTPSGYATIVVLMSFMFAMLFVIVGIIGEYIAIRCV